MKVVEETHTRLVINHQPIGNWISGKPGISQNRIAPLSHSSAYRYIVLLFKGKELPNKKHPIT